jgi:hypothetical protein
LIKLSVAGVKTGGRQSNPEATSDSIASKSKKKLRRQVMKEKTIFFRLPAAWIILLWLSTGLILTGHTAELRDYSLPSEKKGSSAGGSVQVINLDSRMSEKGFTSPGVQSFDPDWKFRTEVRKLKKEWVDTGNFK